jgi:hypothetical protein
MAKATVRTKARTLSKTNRDAAIIERVNRRYNQPGIAEEGLKILAADFEADWFQRAYRDLEDDIYSLAGTLRAANCLHYSVNDMESEASLLYDTAVAMAESLDRKYQSSFERFRKARQDLSAEEARA